MQDRELFVYTDCSYISRVLFISDENIEHVLNVALCIGKVSTFYM